MKRASPLQIGLALGAATLIAISSPIAAHAHITVTPTDADAGSYAVLSFSASHGCEGSPTTSVAITVPEQIESVSPTVNPNWTISVEDNQVVYTALTPLPDGQRDTFELSVKLAEGEAGTEIVFPVLQSCEVGFTAWTAADSDGKEPEHPAPSVLMTESTAANYPTTSMRADPLGRVLGIGGLVLGSAALVVALIGRRKAQP
ncbi:MAG: hypothetical protein JWP30_1587 [Homoserinimonas sp.]|jgi:uncharacterized protein YcnI|nr:hypothetical protein [Homoserinimonas sp.]